MAILRSKAMISKVAGYDHVASLRTAFLIYSGFCSAERLCILKHKMLEKQAQG